MKAIVCLSGIYALTLAITHPAFVYANSAMETPEQCVKYVHS